MSEANNNSSKAGMIGLLIGFAAGALTVLLSDPDNRKKVKETTDDLIDTTREKTRDTLDTVAEKVKDTAGKVQSKVKKSVDQATELVDEQIAQVEEKLKQAD